MIDNTLIEMLSRYKDDVPEEIENISLAIDKIYTELQRISDFLISDLLLCCKSIGINDKNKELQLLKDSQYIREYIEKFNTIKFEKNKQQKYTELNLSDIVVLNHTLKCDLNHDICDVNVILPVLDKNGNINKINVIASYCNNCKRYTITKDVFNNIDGVILCEVINKTGISTDSDEDVEIELAQHQSILYRYGYNVKTKDNLSAKQRHIIIASLVESNILTRNQIIDHLTMLIARGEKIKTWKEAVTKWKEDRYFTQQYNKDNLPSVIANKILLKYNQQID